MKASIPGVSKKYEAQRIRLKIDGMGEAGVKNLPVEPENRRGEAVSSRPKPARRMNLPKAWQDKALQRL